jgi:MFS family permease
MMTDAAETIGGASDLSARPATSISAWIVALLAIAMFINYADRGSLSVAAPVLKDQLSISDAQLGVLLSAFFWSYALAQPIAGSLVQRFDVKRVLAIGLAVWAGATFLTALANGFAALLALRLMMGLGESVIYPANARILSERAPERLRGRCNGLIAMGMCLGPTGGTLVGGLILASFGWRAVFLFLGALSLLWLLPWLATPMGPRGAAPAAPPVRPEPGPGYGEILRRRALWGVSLGQFCYSWQFYLLLTWLPLYLVKSQHLSLTVMAGVGAAVYALQSLAALAGGLGSDALIRRGASPTLVRKAFVLTGVAGGGVAVLVLSLGAPKLAIPCLAASGIFTGIGNPIQFAIGQTLSGPTAGGRWMGIQNMFGNFAGILAPAATGWIVQATGTFTAAFQLAAALSVAGLVCWGLVLVRVEPLQWRPAHSGAPPAEPG